MHPPSRRHRSGRAALLDQSPLSALVLASALSGAACGAPPDEPDAPLAETRQEIHNGTSVTGSNNTDPEALEAAVRLDWPRLLNGTFIGGRCSGIAIANNAIVTAGHCVAKSDLFPNGLEPGETRTIEVDLTTYERSTDKQDTLENVEFEATLHPDYIGGSEKYKADLALLYWDSSSSVSYATRLFLAQVDRAEIYDAPMYVGMRLDIYGWGDNSNDGSGFGSLRKGHDNKRVRVDDIHTHWFEGSSSQARQCTGDSGGPVLRWVGNYEAALGVASRFIPDNGGDACAGNDEPQYWSRLVNRVDWIEDCAGLSCDPVSGVSTRILQCN